MKYIRNEKIISGRLKDELVMMDIDAGRYFGLNEVATRVWEILEQPGSLEEICKILISEYEVDEKQCRQDVEELMGELIRMGLIREK